MIKRALFFFLLICSQVAFAQSVKTRWIDSVFQTMNVSEKVGHLFLVPVDNKSDAESAQHIRQLIQDFEIGGIIFNEKKVLPPPTLLATYHKFSDIPLFVGFNGLASQLPDSTLVFPSPLIIGATSNDTLIYRHGLQLGNYLQGFGINFLFTTLNRTPAQDANVEKTNNLPSDNIVRASRKSIPLMRGLQDRGIITCARYFTVSNVSVGEVRKGDMNVSVSPDSSMAYAFGQMVQQGIKGILVAPNGLPVFFGNMGSIKKSYSAPVLSSVFSAAWLRSNLQFDGLAVINTDEIRSSDAEDGETELLAFKHGNDIIISKDIAAGIKKIKRLVRKNETYKEQLNTSIRKILAAKFDANLWQSDHKTADPLSYAAATDTKILNRRLHTNAITILRNQDDLLPIRVLENRTFAYVSTLHSDEDDMLYEYMTRYTGITNHLLDESVDANEFVKTLRGVNTVIVGVFPETEAKILSKLNSILDQLPHGPEIIVCDFGNALLQKTAYRYNAVATAYEKNRFTLAGMPQAMFGANAVSGSLPYTISPSLKEGFSIQTKSLARLSYALPEDAFMDGRTLNRIDSIAREAIAIHATPGCQVFVARHGKVIYDKSFGYLTYDKKDPVTSRTIYDLASVTKVTATLQAGMFMQEHNLMDLRKKVSTYLPEMKKTNKKDITVIDMLTHQSGLVPFIPMYNSTVKDTTFLPLYYNRVQSDKYPLHVADRLYGSMALRDSVWSWVLKSKMNEKAARTPYSYKYSDLGFMILQHIAERVLNQPMDEFLYQNLYEPLGATTLGFNPLTKFNKQIIAPTEDDKIYRKTSVAGTVHDERAAMLGGVSGHAGLFGTANDLGKLGQMLLQNGWYGGYQYYRPETVRLFTARTFRTSRRGIGWDKPTPSDPNGPTSMYASPLTYGHTGFTGTCIWIDPEFDLVYIFLSNRVYPDRSSKLINANIRSRIQDLIYKSIFAYQEQEQPQYVLRNGDTINTSQIRPPE